MKKLLPILLLFFCIGSANAGIPENFNFYLGAGYGLTKADTGVTGLTGTASLDEDDSGFKVFGGMKINSFFGLELSYADLGSTELTGNNGDGFTIDGTALTFIVDGAKIEAETTTIALEGVIFLPLDKLSGNDSLKYFEPFFKLGVHFWDMEYTVASASTSATTADDDGVDAVFGAGININIIENLSVRAEWQRFMTDEEGDYFSGSVIFNF